MKAEIGYFIKSFLIIGILCAVISLVMTFYIFDDKNWNDFYFSLFFDFLCFGILFALLNFNQQKKALKKIGVKRDYDTLNNRHKIEFETVIEIRDILKAIEGDKRIKKIETSKDGKELIINYRISSLELLTQKIIIEIHPLDEKIKSIKISSRPRNIFRSLYDGNKCYWNLKHFEFLIIDRALNY